MKAASPGPRADPGPDTRTRLLDAAERLFSEHGISSTSLRRITSEAGANLAAVNYHFQTKEGLIEAVFARRIRPLNEERLRRLRSVEKGSGAHGPTVEGILEAFMGPVRDVCEDPARGGSSFLRLMGRANLEPPETIHRLVYAQFTETGMEFFGALARALPDLSPPEIFVRFRFALGAMFFAFAHSLDPRKLDLPDRIVPKSDETLLEDLVTFVAAGLRAPGTKGAS